MIIRRKVFSLLEVDGEERYFSTTEFSLEQREFGNKENKASKRSWQAREGLKEAKRVAAIPNYDGLYKSTIDEVRSNPLMSEIAVNNIGEGKKFTKHGILINGDQIETQNNLLQLGRRDNQVQFRGQKKKRGSKELVEFESSEAHNRLKERAAELRKSRGVTSKLPSSPTPLMVPQPKPQSSVIPNFAERAAQEAKRSRTPIALTPAPESVLHNLTKKELNQTREHRDFWLDEYLNQKDENKSLLQHLDNRNKDYEAHQSNLRQVTGDLNKEKSAHEATKQKLLEEQTAHGATTASKNATEKKLLEEVANHNATSRAKIAAEQNASKLGKSLRRWKVGAGVLAGTTALGASTLAYNHYKKNK